MQRNACFSLHLHRTVPLVRAAAAVVLLQKADVFGWRKGKETLLAATAPVLHPAGLFWGRSLGKGKLGLHLTLAQGDGLAAPRCCAGGCICQRGGEGGCVESWKIICEK